MDATKCGCTFCARCDACHQWDMDARNCSTKDIEHDLVLLIETFGEDDELVVEYKSILKERAILKEKTNGSHKSLRGGRPCLKRRIHMN